LTSIFQISPKFFKIYKNSPTKFKNEEFYYSTQTKRIENKENLVETFELFKMQITLTKHTSRSSL